MEQKQTTNSPFSFLDNVDPSSLLSALRLEHPQTIAVILSAAPPNKASVLLYNLPEEVKSDVTRRMAMLGKIPSSVLFEIARVLEKRIDSEDSMRNLGGVEAVVEVLNLVPRCCEKQVIEALEDEDPELAEEIKRRMLIFEDVVIMSDSVVKKVLRSVDDDVLTAAVRGVDDEVVKKITTNLHPIRRFLFKRMKRPTILLKEVEEAQEKIVSIMRHLDDTGDVVLARSGWDEVIEEGK